MGMSRERTNAANRQPARSDPRWGLNQASKAETPAEWLVSLAMECSM